jgi:hypothetical protein
MIDYHVELVACNRRVISDGHTTIDCNSAFKIMGILKELAACNCEATISNGILILEDGTSFDLEKLVNDASR